MLLIVVVLLCTAWSTGQFINEEERQNWVDPSDMLNFDSATGTMKTKKTVIEPIRSSVTSEETDMEPNQKSGENTDQPASCDDLDKCMTEVKQTKRSLTTCQKQLDSAPPSQAAYLKQFIRVLVERLPHAHGQQQESVAYTATLLLSQADLDLFNDLIYTDRGNLQDSHRTLVSMIQEVRLHGDYRPDTWYNWVLDLFLVHLTTILQMTAVFAMATVGVLATAHIRVSWFSFFNKLLVLLFLISIPWNWWHMYKIELAKRQAKAIQDMPAECNPGDQSVWGLLVTAFSVNVDKCAKYHEQMMVDPIWEVAPTRAIAVTLSKFCVEPLEHIGRSLGKFIRAPLEDLPVQMWPIVLIFLVVVFTLVLIMGFGYKIRLFYLFGIEPADRKQIQGVEELQKGIQALTSQVEMLTEGSNKAADTEKIVERHIQALTATPHWEGRVDHYSPPPAPRYMIENVGYHRGMDIVDSRLGAKGEGFLPMPVPQYPSGQPPADLYPPVSRPSTTTTTHSQPTDIPTLSQVEQQQIRKQNQVLGMPYPQEVNKDSIIQTPLQTPIPDSNADKASVTSTKAKDDSNLQARGPVTVETVTAASEIHTSGIKVGGPEINGNHIGDGVWSGFGKADQAINGHCDGEFLQVNPKEKPEESPSDGGETKVNGTENVKVAEEEKVVRLRPEVENIGSDC